ncbi:MAG TPA: SDR family oxidoreductase [Acidimicrobiales bacterium]|nr:SDR family oxidoreductase [Acidimicrobiales bacterium]
MSQPLLDGKRILVTGIANAGSIAHATAARAHELGATVVTTAMPRDLVGAQDAAADIAADVAVLAMDATSPTDLEAVATWVGDELGGLDGALHAIAFAPKAALGSVAGVPAEAVELAFRTSVHTYVELGQLLADLAPPAGASLVGLDFDASRAWPTYNWMGVCKSALEGANRYLARELGPRRVRSNLVAAGPLETRAASAIPGFDLLLDSWEQRAPLGWDPHDAGPVADAVCFLLSDLARAVTGEILQVDGGHHAMA